MHKGICVNSEVIRIGGWSKDTAQMKFRIWTWVLEKQPQFCFLKLNFLYREMV